MTIFGEQLSATTVFVNAYWGGFLSCLALLDFLIWTSPPARKRRMEKTIYGKDEAA